MTDRDTGGVLLSAWWNTFVATGKAPADLTPVQSRLIRSVHRGALPSGEVFVKAMTFPRWKDRLRYLLRALPAQHEARLLRGAVAAGIPAPQVVDVRVARRCGLPSRSWLVLRGLPVAVDHAPESDRTRLEAALVMRLLRAGIVHRDLHTDNFVRLADGGLAVLDLQSAQIHRSPRSGARHRLAAAARMLRDRADLTGCAAAMREAGLLVGDREQAEVLAMAEEQRLAYLRRRVLRCFLESTEFTRTVRWNGIEYRRRDHVAGGYWLQGGRELRRCWIGQRALQVFGARSPVFSAFFQKWWWLGGACALYVPPQCREDRIQAERIAAADGYAHFCECTKTQGTQADGAKPA